MNMPPDKNAAPTKPEVVVESSHLGVRLLCNKWGCSYDEYVGQSLPLSRVNELAQEHLASHEG